MADKEAIKVVQIIPRLNNGGAERGAIDLALEHQRAGVANHFIISEGGRLAIDAIKNGVRFLPLSVASKNPLTFVSRATKLRRVLSAINPDIVHIRSRVPAWLHCLANRELHIPTVSTVHGINSVNFYSKVMTYADAIICPGTAVAEHIRRAYNAQNITVIGRGVDMEYFNPNNVDVAAVEKLRQQWDLSNQRIILHVGRLSEQKGHHILLEAMAKLPKNNIAIIVGEGSWRNRLIKQAQRLNISHRIIFAGARDDIREIYALADVVLSCAIKPETFGRTIAEALAMQKPIIASDHGGARDIITQKETGGKLIPPANVEALVAALKDTLPNAEQSRAHVEKKFTAQNMATKTMEVYRKAIKARGK